MYNYIKGTVTEISPDNITLETSGIGYLIITPNPYNFLLHSELTVYIYQKVTDDNISLYGFKTLKAKALFIKLISVNGIGPKSASAILASGSVESITQAIDDSNAKYLQKFPGIGPKSSQQIILDLKGKIEFEDKAIKTANIIEVEEALRALGFKAKEIKKLLPRLDTSKNTSDLVKDALAM
ncbi:MAG: Holliday junction branch migration protein RuvA, partial [Tenericutes bacterium]|nr:Holliday junction branch migration protein RuvA [Mycoplasmatota bacterium]